MQRVLDGDPVEREKALLELRAKFGPWAVPALVGPLGDRSNPDHRVSAVQALVRLGSDAGLPLIATLQSDDVTTRRNAAAVLGTLRTRAPRPRWRSSPATTPTKPRARSPPTRCPSSIPPAPIP